MLIDVSADGFLSWGGHRARCALGRGGVVADKREGDGGTPAGRFALRTVHYRADRSPRPRCRLPVHAIATDDGWCDAPDHPLYNRAVKRPFAASHEALWRDDALYDLFVVIGYNDAPPAPGRGSAIFLHVAAPGYAPTAGCVALARGDLADLVDALAPGDAIAIAAAG